MAWYAASVIMLFEYEDAVQDDFPVWENVYLVEAESEELAIDKAISFGKEDEGNDSGSLTVNNRKARKVFQGVRKLITVINLNSDEDVPGDGAEVTFSDFLLKSKADLEKLVQGDPVQLSYID